jgi:hypothetical protein
VFEKYIEGAGLSLKMPEDEFDTRELLRLRSKKTTLKKQDNYVDGRLGLIIDGTGGNYDKIAKQSIGLRQLGYDTHMIFVNTSLDTALERNAKRDRTVPKSVAITKWKDVQANMGKFSQHFKRNFIVVDNNNSEEDVMTPVFKQVKGLLKYKVNSPLAHEWVQNQMKLKGITKAPKGW